MASALNLDTFRSLFGWSKPAPMEDAAENALRQRKLAAKLWARHAQDVARRLGGYASLDVFMPLGEECASLNGYEARMAHLRQRLKDVAGPYIGFKDGDGI